ncbi:MAG: VTT domain-containing protein [Burkholderiales bacterium]
MTAGTRFRLMVAAAFVLAMIAAYWLLHETGALAIILDGHALRKFIMGLGMAGPIAIIALMIVAVLVSPIPSAPIALAAGALYGHTWGTGYIALGAELGALAAFGLARLLGQDALQRWFGSRLPNARLGSQNALMAIVFVSRLLPFISFDVVSYAAGFTTLTWWRFALATFAGILPASFLLAHFGEQMGTGELDRILYAVLALGLLTSVPLLVHYVRQRMRARARQGSTLDR